MTNPYFPQVIILDTSLFFSDGLERCLQQSGHRVISHARDLAGITLDISLSTPSLALIGPNFTESESLALCRTIIANWPSLKLIIYSQHASDLLFQADAATIGVSVCLPNNADEIDTLEAVRVALAGRSLFSTKALSRALQPEPLTPQEHAVLKLLAVNNSDKEIASKLKLSTATVRNHSQHILEKLQVHMRQEAVRRAQRLGWLC